VGGPAGKNGNGTALGKTLLATLRRAREAGDDDALAEEADEHAALAAPGATDETDAGAFLDDDALDGITPAGPDAVVLRPEAPADGPPPPEVLELAAACVRFVTATVKVEPDFLAETLPLVDHYVEQARAAVRERRETLPLTARAVGAYLGEVVRRAHRSWWRIDEGDPGAWRLEFEDVLLAFYPVQVAFSALTLDEGARSFGGFEMRRGDREAVVRRLRELPDVSEREYFLPSTRLELLDIVLDELGARKMVDRYARERLGPGDYE
jgi:hypothetical protein